MNPTHSPSNFAQDVRASSEALDPTSAQARAETQAPRDSSVPAVQQAMPLDEAALAALAARIRTWGRELGFGAIGISDTDLSHAEAGLAAWLEAGCHGEMDYMAKHEMKRARP